LQLSRSVRCKWCGCETGEQGDHKTIEECVQALEREVAERRSALAARSRPGSGPSPAAPTIPDIPNDPDKTPER
jgi:hypothetical protein